MKYSAVYALISSEMKVSFDIALVGSIESIATLLEKLGYDGIEINVSDPFSVDLNEVSKIVKEKNLEVPAISTGLSYLKYGLSLSGSDEEREKAMKILCEHMKIAYKLESKGVVVGLIRGRCPRENLRGIYIDRLINFLFKLDKQAEDLA